MAGDEAGRRTPTGPAELVGLIAGDAERLLAQHLELVRGEVRERLTGVPVAAAAVGAGAALVATGGVLGALMLVHGLHRSTRLPLWGCYGAVGGLSAALGIGLLGAGARRAAGVSLVPRETFAVLKEDVQWIKGQLTTPPPAT